MGRYVIYHRLLGERKLPKDDSPKGDSWHWRIAEAETSEYATITVQVTNENKSAGFHPLDSDITFLSSVEAKDFIRP